MLLNAVCSAPHSFVNFVSIPAESNRRPIIADDPVKQRSCQRLPAKIQFLATGYRRCR
jgi:hypothetical protein